MRKSERIEQIHIPVSKSQARRWEGSSKHSEAVATEWRLELQYSVYLCKKKYLKVEKLTISNLPLVFK